MYTPLWTLNEKDLEIKKSPYIKNREADLAVSVSRVQDLFEKNKNKTFSNDEIAETLGISLGTVSDITNRLEAIADIKIVKVRQLRSALAQVFQHWDGPLHAVPKERGKRDAIINVLEQFQKAPEKVFTKDDLVKDLDNTEAKIRRALQILLLDEKIKLVGHTKKGTAEYQYYKGHLKGFKINRESDSSYTSIPNFIKANGLKIKRDDLIQVIDVSKVRLFYSSTGITYEYPIQELEEGIKKIELKKTAKRSKGLISSIFS